MVSLSNQDPRIRPAAGPRMIFKRDGVASGLNARTIVDLARSSKVERSDHIDCSDHID